MFYEAIDHSSRRMSTDHPLELNRAVPGGRVEMFAIRDEEYPGGWFYRFQYYHPEDGPILRYDNAHDDDDLGWHHRHVRYGEDSEISFHNIVSHIARFLQEIVYLTQEEQEDHD
jgi:hypothetical protein